jgi:exopolyphosphatase/guanosine-5'-triphosphate,3'-diphosphate pyrophosphatase
MNVGAIDIGTNSVRVLITNAAGEELERHMQITRLGQGVDVSGELQPEAIERTRAVLAEYAALLRKHTVMRLRAAATSAARDAKNSAEFFAAAKSALGTRPELLSGQEEARLSFIGASLGLDPAPGPSLVVDIGGGSTEFVLGDQRPDALISVNMGCVRMTERYLKSDPPSSAELAACTQAVRALLVTVQKAVPVRTARRMIGLAGTITSLAALQLGLLHYDASQTHHSVLTREQVEAQFARLASADLRARRAMLAEPKRAEVIVGGAAVLATILREFDIPELLVSETDILDGLAASLR